MTTTTFLTIQGAYFLVVALSTLMLIRNAQVYTFMVALIELVSEAATDDIAKGKAWWWRYEEYDRVSYSRMMLEFWKPVKVRSWWPDASFLRIDK